MGSPAVKTWSHSMRNTETLVDFFKLTSVTWKPPALRSSLAISGVEFISNTSYHPSTLIPQIRLPPLKLTMTSVLHSIQGRRLWAAAASGRLNKIEWRWRRREKDEESRTKWESFIEAAGKKRALRKFAVGEIEEESARQGSEYK